MLSKMKRYVRIAVTVTGISFIAVSANAMNVSMNIDTPRYFSNYTIFNDLSKTASKLIPFDIKDGGWQVKNFDDIKLTADGYPEFLPIEKYGKYYGVRVAFQNQPGTYLVKFEGSGKIEINGTRSQKNTPEGTVINIDGRGRFFINILKSDVLNPIRNIKILPYSDDGSLITETFNQNFLSGLKPFDTIRFYKWQDCDASMERSWSDRTTKEYITQEVSASIEYAVELANTIKKNAWFCIPYAADDQYIFHLAKYVKENLDPTLNIYIEYSNELWNFRFIGSRFVLNNGVSEDYPELNAAPYIQQDLKAIQKKYCGRGNCHPEKDAYMMARSYKIWKTVFQDARPGRLITVAAVQQAWPTNTAKILDYFDDIKFKVDAIAGGAYFKFEKTDHERWMSGDPEKVQVTEVLSEAENYLSKARKWADKHAKLAKKHNVDYVIYEGGQHMQPYLQKEWPYNQAVYDAQIHPSIYELYQKNLNIYAQAGVKNFVAYSYISERESKWGSWGHIENLSDLDKDLRQVAPKYAALVDYIKANQKN